MKECPICKAIAFDDAKICYGCLHRFDEEHPVRAASSDPSDDVGGWLGTDARDPSMEGGRTLGLSRSADAANPRADVCSESGGAPEDGVCAMLRRDQDAADRATMRSSVGDGTAQSVFRTKGFAQGDGADGGKGWTVSIEFRDSSSSFGKSVGIRPFDRKDAAPCFMALEDGFAVSVRIAAEEAWPAAGPSPHRRLAHPSRSVLRRHLPRAVEVAAPVGISTEPTG